MTKSMCQYAVSRQQTQKMRKSLSTIDELMCDLGRYLKDDHFTALVATCLPAISAFNLCWSTAQKRHHQTVFQIRISDLIMLEA